MASACGCREMELHGLSERHAVLCCAHQRRDLCAGTGWHGAWMRDGRLALLGLGLKDDSEPHECLDALMPNKSVYATDACTHIDVRTLQAAGCYAGAGRPSTDKSHSRLERASSVFEEGEEDRTSTGGQRACPARAYSDSRGSRASCPR